MKRKTGPKGPASPLTLDEVARVKKVVRNDPRDTALFVLGCNSAFRGGDLLALNVRDVRGRKDLQLREKKTGKLRTVLLNEGVRAALAVLCVGRPDDAPLFVGQKRGTRLTVCTLAKLWRKWCEAAGIKKLVSSHSGRKTWARLNFERGARIEVISKALNHSSPATTFTYLGLMDSDFNKLYETEI